MTTQAITHTPSTQPHPQTEPDPQPGPVTLPAGQQRLFAEAADRLAGWHAEVTPTDLEVARLAHALAVTS